MAWSILLNVLSAVFNIFSFTLIIPILQILFGLDTTVYEFMPWDSGAPIKDLAINNMYYYVTWAIATWGPSRTLLLLGLFMMLMTALKTSCYFGSSAIMVPIRTGIVRDIRTQVYNKLLSLPMGFFSQQKKGDIIARMSGDVNEIEHSITSSLDMLIKNPILIFFYFTTLIVTSWQLTLFTIAVVPLMAWGMSAIGKKLIHRVNIGATISPEEIASYGDIGELCARLRGAVYDMPSATGYTPRSELTRDGIL